MEMKWLFTSAFTQICGHSNHMDQAKNCVIPRNNVKMMKKEEFPSGFQVPLHYPRYSKADYEAMDDLSLDLLLKQYGFTFEGSLDEKRVFAMESFLWPDQL